MEIFLSIRRSPNHVGCGGAVPWVATCKFNTPGLSKYTYRHIQVHLHGTESSDSYPWRSPVRILIRQG